MTERPEFATNRPPSPSTGATGETVADSVNDLLNGLTDSLKHPPQLDIATAYFNVGGFGTIAEALEQVGPVRILLGSEPTEAQVRATITPLAVRGAHKGDPRVDHAMQEYDHALAEDRDLAGFGRAADEASERLIAWLRRGNIEVRRIRDGFLHGKAFIVRNEGWAAFAGSANLTYAGLMLNRELNLGVYHPSTVQKAHDWFEEQWAAAVDFDLAGLYEERRVPHDPWHVFLRMLLALYGSNLDVDVRVNNELGLADFQIDGVWRAKRILEQRGGVIVADEVGLGKTYIAGELIRQAVIERRQKVLVISPATLRDSTWLPFLRDKAIRADVVSYEQLIVELPQAGKYPYSKLQALDEYAMVVVDEAHNLRNALTLRAEAMRELLGGAVGKDLLLLTATPVNNSLRDLQTLVTYISPSDAAFSDVGVRSVKGYFDVAMALDPDELTGEHLFELLDAIAVRRTRRFIKTQYPSAEVNGKPIVFPQAVVHRVDYHLDEVLPGFFPRFAHALGVDRDEIGVEHVAGEPDPDVLTMARYVPSRFLLTADVEQYQVQNAGLLQSALLKRFESSAVAFTSTVHTMMRSHDQFLTALDGGWVLRGDALRAWVASDTDDVDTLVRDLDEEGAQNAEATAIYDVETLRRAVESDRALLGRLAAEAAQVTLAHDPKIDALVEELAAIAGRARAEGIGEQDTRDRQKVIVFTYFADTAQHIADALTVRIGNDPRLTDYVGRVVMATGSDRKERQKAIVGFAPRTAHPDGDSEDLFDIAIATDVLSEGVNLQQAANIVNYDLPWNPMRLVQRHGRVDRIGSRHSHIHLRCFFPDDELELLLKLEDRLQRKLKQAAAAFGTSMVLPDTDEVDRVMSETRGEIDRLRDEDASLFGDATDSAASSEEFQRRLFMAFRSSQTKAAVERLPRGAGSGIVRAGADPGVVYCVTVADHPRPQFRYVPLERAENGGYRSKAGEDKVLDRLLFCLNQADPHSAGTPPVLPPELHDAVLDVWPLVQRDVYDAWMVQTDPSMVDPSLPRVMRDAAATVRKHGAFLGDQQDVLTKRLEQQVENRIQRDVRAALRENEADPVAAVSALKALADAVRLPVPVPVEPLPEIRLDDVRVLCWMAVHPGT